MEGCRVKELAEAISGRIIQGSPDTVINGISIDSRTLLPGDLFFALKGCKVDGHSFAMEALNKGAVGIVVSKRRKNLLPLEEIAKDKIILVTEDTLTALQDWSKYYKSKLKTFNIGVTGSNGKSTTKEMIAHLLSPKFSLLKSSGNYNTEIGIPLTLLQLKPDHKILVVEMGMRGLGEIKTLTELVPPDLAVITNIGESHLGLLGSRDNIFRAKSELLQSLGSKGIAILNRDDLYFSRMAEIVKDKKIITFGLENRSDIMADNITSMGERGIRFTLKIKDRITEEIFLPLLGRHNIYNALAATAVAFALQVDLELVKKGLANFETLDKRIQLIKLYDDIKVLDDSYNASPQSVRKALETLVEVAKDRRKIAILGDMLELGKKANFYHQQIGQEIAQLAIDLLITVGKGGEIIAQAAEKEGMAQEQIFSFEKDGKKLLVQKLINLVKPGDFVLLKGSREMQMEDILQFWQEEHSASVLTQGGQND